MGVFHRYAMLGGAHESFAGKFRKIMENQKQGDCPAEIPPIADIEADSFTGKEVFGPEIGCWFGRDYRFACTRHPPPLCDTGERFDGHGVVDLGQPQ